MNKRIKELAEQAELIEIVDDAYQERGTWQPFVEKFAELIVKECMKAADEGMAQVTMKVEWPSYHIKKHFGVETGMNTYEKKKEV